MENLLSKLFSFWFQGLTVLNIVALPSILLCSFIKLKVLSSQNTKRILLGFAANNSDTELYISTKDGSSIKLPFSEKNVKPYICCPTSENTYIGFGFKCLTNSDFLVLTKRCDEIHIGVIWCQWCFKLFWY